MSEISNNEVENVSEVSEEETEEGFSAELDESYSSYMEDGKFDNLDKSDAGKKKGDNSVDDTWDHDLDGKYSDYLNGRHTNKEVREEDLTSLERAKGKKDDLDAELDKKYSEYIGAGNKEAKTVENPRRELTEEDRAALKVETGWSNEIVDSIETVEQANIYKNADLHEETINGRKCLVKEIDYDYVDEKTGMTNRELMAKGRSPYDAKTGEKIELHHMGQNFDAPLAELTENSEHGDGNHSTLHSKTEGSWRNDETLDAQYRKEKREHWQTRSEVK